MATVKTFVDTQAFYSSVSAHDPHHRRVGEILRDPQRSFCTTDWIIGETINLLTARRVPHLALRFLDTLEASPSLQIVHGSESLFQDACRLLRKYREHAFPFTDCTSFVVMRQLKIMDALTEDRHFSALGFNVLLP